MEQLKMFAFFRVHPFIGIVIVSVVAIFALGLFFYSAPTAYGIPFGGQVTAYNFCLTTDLGTPPPLTCMSTCPLGCGVTSVVCGNLNELQVGGQVYCPAKTFPYITGGMPRIGGWILGLGTPNIPMGITPPTGVSL